jgi:Zn-dependent peptidase ImmA (M78 family)
MASLSISPDVLAWAAAKLGTSVRGLAEEMAAASKVESFASGQLSAGQVSELASRLGVPFGFLFLPSPPGERAVALPDLRQTVGPEPLDRSFIETLDDIELKRTWFAAHLRDSGIDGPDFVGRFAGKQVLAKVVADDIRATLKLTPDDRRESRTYAGFYELLANRFESAGVLVFRSGVARGNPHRPLSVTQFRGFAICDPLVPVIFVNGRDAEPAWIFTLLHEAAHLWLGVTGVSDTTASVADAGEGLEAFCNQVAAEVLVPLDEFLEVWTSSEGPAPIDALARHFVVSRLVVARRALDLRLIDRTIYEQILEASRGKREAEGGNPYATIPIRSSRRFTNALLDSAIAGETLLREAARLLNVRASTVIELHKRRTGGGREAAVA